MLHKQGVNVDSNSDFKVLDIWWKNTEFVLLIHPNKISAILMS